MRAISGLRNTGLDTVWRDIDAHRETLDQAGALAAKRADQAVRWMHDMVEAELRETWARNPTVTAAIAEVEQAVRAGTLAPSAGAETLVTTAKRAFEPDRATGNAHVA